MTTHIWDQLDEIYGTSKVWKWIFPTLEYIEQAAFSSKTDSILLNKEELCSIVDYVLELVSKCERLEQELYEEQKRHDPQNGY